MSIVVSTPPTTWGELEGFRRHLRQFAVEVSVWSLRHQTKDGHWHEDPNPKAVAGVATAANVVSAAVAAPTASTSMLAVGAAALPILPVVLGVIAAVGIATSQKEKQNPVVKSEFTLSWANVGPDREAWAERLLCTYGAGRGWLYAGLRYPEMVAQGQNFFQRYGRSPVPWSKSRDPFAWSVTRPERKKKSWL